MLLTNAILCDIDPIRVEAGSLRIDNGVIAARGGITPMPGEEVIDCAGAVVLPGLVNGHTHLYSALAVGMPPPPRAPRDFHEILQLIWWRLDQALDAESNEVSATIGALDALHCGTTTLIDHHASPRAIGGSLDAIERGIATVGLRGVLCYETTDRHGKDGALKGIAENHRYSKKTRNPMFSRRAHAAPFFGAHASFTLEDDTLEALSRESNVHIHVAEDPCDDLLTRQKHHKCLFHRLAPLLRPDSIFAHCIHLDDRAIAALNDAQVTIAHNPRSNMNNSVGYAPLAKLTCPIMLGTDGIGGDMFAEAKAAWLKSRDAGARLSPARIIDMLATSARRASQALGVMLGKLQIGAAADVVVTDYVPFTPIHTDNFAGHFLFGMNSSNIRHVFIDGAWALRERIVVRCHEQPQRLRASSVAQALWHRMESVP